MALPKLYEQIVWHNNTTPALNEDNLNSMSQAIEDIDDRVIDIASTIMEDVPIIEERLEALDPPIRVVKDFAGVQALTDALDKNAVDVKVKITPKQAGSGTPSPDNIRAITGFTEAKVTRTGKNLFDVGTSMSDWFLASTNGTIPLSMAGSARVTATVDRATSSVQTTAYINNEYYWPCKMVKLEKNKAYRVTYGSVVNPDRIHLFGRTSGASAGTNIGNLSNGALINSGNYDEWWIGYFPMSSAPRTSFTKMLFRAEDVHDGSFEPYTGTTYTISLGDTRYLAELDVTSGELTVKGAYTTLTSVERLSTNTSGQYRFASNGSYADAKVPSSNTQIATIYSSMFNAISADNTYAKVEGIALHTNGRIFLYSDAWKTKTAAEVNAILTDTPLQIVYELATPVTVQLTATEVALLYTYNVLWADTGDLALTYDASGVLRIANSKLDIDTFKSIVASSSDFADFKSKVAAL